MITLDYFFEHGNGETQHYQLIQFAVKTPWLIIDGDELLGRIEKMDGQWISDADTQLSAEMVQAAGKLIDKQHYNALPSEILSRWPKLVAEVITKSDSEYLVVCRAEISFEIFERVFTQFLPAMLKDEWPITFQVYNSDFSKDFVLEARAKKEEFVNHALKQWQV